MTSWWSWMMMDDVQHIHEHPTMDKQENALSSRRVKDRFPPRVPGWIDRGRHIASLPGKTHLLAWPGTGQPCANVRLLWLCWRWMDDTQLSTNKDPQWISVIWNITNKHQSRGEGRSFRRSLGPSPSDIKWSSSPFRSSRCVDRPPGVPGMQTMRPGPSGYHRDGGHGGNAYGGNGGNFGRHEKGKKLEYAFFLAPAPSSWMPLPKC